MYEAILALLLSLPPASSDTETAPERHVRMSIIAHAIHQATERVPWPSAKVHQAGALVALGWYESRFAQDVHEGRCPAGWCDHGRARSPWQLHRGAARGDWESLDSARPEATNTAALRAAQLLARNVGQCGGGDWLSGALSLYGTGKHCDWPEAAERARLARKHGRWIRGRLSRAQ